MCILASSTRKCSKCEYVHREERSLHCLNGQIFGFICFDLRTFVYLMQAPLFLLLPSLHTARNKQANWDFVESCGDCPVTSSVRNLSHRFHWTRAQSSSKCPSWGFSYKKRRFKRPKVWDVWTVNSEFERFHIVAKRPKLLQWPKLWDVWNTLSYRRDIWGIIQ